MIHQAGSGSWTRRHEVARESNRLLSTSLPGDPEAAPYSAGYTHDDHGNITSVPGFRYQIDNHLGSAALELDDTAPVISCENTTLAERSLIMRSGQVAGGGARNIRSVVAIGGR